MRILIPAYEPGGTLLDVIQAIKANCKMEIVIVDDGSGPAYAPIFTLAEALGCMVLNHPRNLGKGAALKTGFRHLLAIGEKDGVVCADCDGQHTATDICRVAAETRKHFSNVVLGSRQFSGDVPFRSKLGNAVTRGVFRMSAGYRIQDTQTGLRGYPASMLPWLCEIEGARFEYELNLLLALKPAGYGVREIVISTIYDGGNKGSHFRPIVDSIRVYLPFLKFSASSLMAGLIDFILLLLFNTLFGSLLAAVILSRAISSILNYSCNKHLVFKNGKQSDRQSAPRYFALVPVILMLNYLLLKTCVLIGLPLVIAKVLTESALFLLSYEAQKRIVFAETHAKPHTPNI